MVNSKKLLAIGIVLVMSIVIFSSCQTSTDKDSTSTKNISGSVKISGSNSMEKIAKALKEAFEEKYDKVTVDVQLGGSSVGVTDAQSGKSDIGNVSRELKATETGLTANKIAIDGIAIIINKENTVKNLSKEQLVKIYKGEIKNWKEVGGKDLPIVVIGREASSGTRDAFETILGIKDLCKLSQEKNETGAIKTAVQTTQAAIGYITLEALDNLVVGVKMDNVEPTTKNITNGKYLLSRPFIMATKEGSTLRPEVKAFLDFVLSSEGQKVVTDLKLISVA